MLNYVLQYVQILRWLYCYMYCNMCKYSEYCNMFQYWDNALIMYFNMYKFTVFWYCNTHNYRYYTVMCTEICANIENLLLMYCYMCKCWGNTVICTAICVKRFYCILVVTAIYLPLLILCSYMYCNMCKYWDYTAICGKWRFCCIQVLQNVQTLRCFCNWYCRHMCKNWDITANQSLFPAETIKALHWNCMHCTSSKLKQSKIRYK